MNIAEQAFYAHLTNVDSLEYMVKEGFSLELAREVIPTEVGRRVTEWAIKYFFDSGRTVAPTKEAIMQTWGDQLEPLDIEIIDDVETDSIQWAIDQLRTDFADFQTGVFATAMVKAVRKADGPDRVGVVQEYSQLLHMLSQALISRRNEMDGAEGIADAIKRYEERELNKGIYDGITFGLPEVDNHFMGIHDGELGVFAATSGGGKSWFSIIVMLAAFARGKKAVLFTLENDVEMTYDRIACVACRVDYEKWQRAECDEGDKLRVKNFLEKMEASDKRPLIIQPDTTECTGQAMIRRAIVEEAEVVIIDQLTHIEAVPGSKARQRNEVVAEIVKDLYKLINNHGYKVPLFLLHQINRKGREEARKLGYYLMDHLGEATQVENTATFVWALYQSPDHVISETAELQTLKSRRTKVKNWEIDWRPAVGHVKVRREIERD